MLAALGKREDAYCAFSFLGEAANKLGHVALAVTCSRWLQQAGQKPIAERLIDVVAETHCAGSKKIDWSVRPSPPAPPPPSATVDVGSPTLEAAVKTANDAVAAALKAATERAPDKLAPTPLVRFLDPGDFRKLVGVMQLMRRPAGQVVVKVGEPAKSLFWIARGTMSVTRDEHALGELRSGAFFGEIALVGGTTRTARVTCLDECWLLEIPADSIEATASRAPKLAKVLAEYARSRLLANVMRTSELFSRLGEDERRQLLARFSTKLAAPGEVLIEQGADNDTLFVVVSGRCEVRDDDAVVASLSVGDGVGEISLLARKPAVATVVAAEETALLCLSRKAFDDIAVKHPTLLAEVYKLLVEREEANRDAIIHDAEELII
jgi:CRP-like cAMP-binding protein